MRAPVGMRLAAVVLLLLAACGARHPAGGNERVTEYVGGRWYDDARREFVPRTVWVAGDRFIERPAHVDAVVDLAGRFVVPPFAEGHNHWLEPALADVYIAAHLRQGIFYVRDMSTPPAFHDAIRAKVNRPDSIDYAAAHQGFTGPRAHPIEIVDALAGMGVLPKEWAATHGEGDALFVVTSEAQVGAAWPRLVAGKPDFVKVFLGRSEDPQDDPKQRGIDPALVPGIVAKSHVAGLRVAAHIVTAHDFHVAIAAGVDDIAHLPFVQAGDLARYRLADADIRAAGARHVTVATTLEWLDGAAPDDPRLALVRDTLTRLRAAGAVIVIGTDLFRVTARAEAERIHALGLMNTAELLHAWCVATPRAIFPARDLGRLEPGAEASFLVLSGDPLADFAHVRDIVRWVKQGRELTPAATEMPAAPP